MECPRKYLFFSIKMTEVFNHFLDELTRELNQRGANVKTLRLKNKRLTVDLGNGMQIPINNVPIPNETMLFVASKFMNAKKIASLFDKHSTKRSLTRDDGGAAEASVSIFSILAIIILVLLVLGAVTWFFNRQNTTVVNPPTA